MAWFRHQLIPWLRQLKHSGLSVPRFYEANQGFDQRRLLFENRATLDRRWCDQSTYLNPVTRKYDNYLKWLDRVLTDRQCLGKYCHLRDYFLLVDPLAYRNVLKNPFNTYHPTMYHRKSKEEERDTPIPYFRHAVQPFLQGLLDSGKTVP